MTLVPIVEQLDEEHGMVKITLGDLYGFVSSWHLVDPKVNQLLQLLKEEM